MDDNNNSEARSVLLTTGVLDPFSALTEIHLADGRILRLPTALLEGATAEALNGDLSAAGTNSGGMVTIPLIEERLQVSRRTVTTGTVRLEKTVQSFETQLDEPLAVRTFDIERVVLNTPVESAPAVRQEGDTTVYPVVEEQLILTKQLVLKEELRVTRRDTERRDTQTVVLRREHISVERENA